MRVLWVVAGGLVVACLLLAMVEWRLRRSERRADAFTRDVVEALDRIGRANPPIEFGAMQHTYTWTSGGHRRVVVVTKDEHGPESLADFDARAAAEYAAGKAEWPPDAQ